MAGLVAASDYAGADLWGMLNEEFEQQKRRLPSKRRRGLQQRVEYDGEDDEDPKIVKWRAAWMGRIAAALVQEYGTHGEMIQMEAWAGLIVITLPPLIIAPDGVNINLTKEFDPVRTAIRLFGELLERFRLSRERFHAADVRARMQDRNMVDARNGIIPV